MTTNIGLLRCRRCGCLVKDDGPESWLCSSCGSVVVLPLDEDEEEVLRSRIWDRVELAINSL